MDMQGGTSNSPSFYKSSGSLGYEQTYVADLEQQQLIPEVVTRRAVDSGHTVADGYDEDQATHVVRMYPPTQVPPGHDYMLYEDSFRITVPAPSGVVGDLDYTLRLPSPIKIVKELALTFAARQTNMVAAKYVALLSAHAAQTVEQISPLIQVRCHRVAGATGWFDRECRVSFYSGVPFSPEERVQVMDE